MIMSSTRRCDSWAECKLAHNLPAASQVLPPRNPVHPPEANGGMATTIYMYMLLTKPLHINSYNKHRNTLMNIMLTG